MAATTLKSGLEEVERDDDKRLPFLLTKVEIKLLGSAGIGFLPDAYDLFIINQIATMLQYSSPVTTIGLPITYPTPDDAHGEVTRFDGVRHIDVGVFLALVFGALYERYVLPEARRRYGAADP